jgi:hypothetical protein
MNNKQKLSACVEALRSLHRVLNMPLPNHIHRAYINEVLERIGEKPE